MIMLTLKRFVTFATSRYSAVASARVMRRNPKTRAHPTGPKHNSLAISLMRYREI